jgi:hypothetical protein
MSQRATHQSKARSAAERSGPCVAHQALLIRYMVISGGEYKQQGLQKVSQVEKSCTKYDMMDDQGHKTLQSYCRNVYCTSDGCYTICHH